MSQGVLRVITPPADLPVSLDEACAACRVDHIDDNAEIEGYIETAVQWLQPPLGWLRRSMLQQTLRLELRNWPCHEFELKAGPVSEITGITYFDSLNAEQTLDPSSYFLDGDALVFGRFFWPPITYCRPGAVRITYVAGYADAQSLPRPIRSAVLAIVAHLYTNRGDVGVSMPTQVEELLAPLRW